MESIFLLLAISLIVSFSFKEIFRYLGLPVVVGQIFAGIILGIPFIKILFFSESAINAISFLSQLGIVFLLFLAGLEINIPQLLRSVKDSVLIAFSSAFLSFILGFSVIHFLMRDALTAMGFDPFIVAIIFGIGLSVTAEGTTVKVLLDLKVLDTKLGTIILGAGTIDDIIEVIALTAVIIIGKGGGTLKLGLIPLQLVVFAVLSYMFFKITSKELKYIERKETDVDLYLLVLIMVFLVSAFSELLELGYLIGAIVAGILLQISMHQVKKKNGREKMEEDEVKETLKLMTFAFLAPFFFIYIGMNFNAQSLLSIHPLVLIVTIGLAIIGKVLGTVIVKPFTKLKMKQLYVIGWAMNSRGAVELIIALTAFNFGLIPLEIFSILVATSIITTLIFPFVVENSIKKDRRIMD